MKAISIGILASTLLLGACNSGNTTTETDTATVNDLSIGELADLKDFPKDWVMVTNITPDSIIGNYVVMYDTDSAYYGTANFIADSGIVRLTVKDYLAADVYQVKSCKRVAEAEMVYYNFELLAPISKEIKKLQVNYRENPDNPQSSVWDFKGPSGQESIEFVSKQLSIKFKPYYNNDEY